MTSVENAPDGINRVISSSPWIGVRCTKYLFVALPVVRIHAVLRGGGGVSCPKMLVVRAVLPKNEVALKMASVIWGFCKNGSYLIARDAFAPL